jgi:hypothetical protein
MLRVRVAVPSAALSALHSDVGAVIVIPELCVVQLADSVLHVLSDTVEEGRVNRAGGKREERRGEDRREEKCTAEEREDERRRRRRREKVTQREVSSEEYEIVEVNEGKRKWVE